MFAQPSILTYGQRDGVAMYKGNSGLFSGTRGSGSSNGSNSGSGSGGGNAAIPSMNISNLPQNVQNIYNQYDKSGWQGNVSGQTPGTGAGSTWKNNKNQLPSTDLSGNPITYKEFDVNNKIAGAGRDSERFVVGSDGSVYYTNDHYITFNKIK